MYFAFACVNIYDTTGSSYYFGNTGRAYYKPFALGRISKPTQLVYISDAKPRFAGARWPYDTVYGTTGDNIDERHPPLTSNYLFYDGHSGRYRWLFVYSSNWTVAAIP
jgi:prepilin-type processing-associated H-X9-DG protein